MKPAVLILLYIASAWSLDGLTGNSDVVVTSVGTNNVAPELTFFQISNTGSIPIGTTVNFHANCTGGCAYVYVTATNGEFVVGHAGSSTCSFTPYRCDQYVVSAGYTKCSCGATQKLNPAAVIGSGISTTHLGSTSYALQVVIGDMAGNLRYYSSADLAQAGFSSLFIVAGTTVLDKTPPSVTAFTASITSLNAEALISYSWNTNVHVIDSGTGATGIQEIDVYYQPPAGTVQDWTTASFLGYDNVGGGNDFNAPISIGQLGLGLVNGLYTPIILIQDVFGNWHSTSTESLASSGFTGAAGVLVANVTGGDSTAPVCTSIIADTNAVDVTSQNRDITFSAECSDTGGSGVSGLTLFVEAPGGYTFVKSAASLSLTITIPQGFPAGNYRVSGLIVSDNKKNTRLYGACSASYTARTALVGLTGTRLDPCGVSTATSIIKHNPIFNVIFCLFMIGVAFVAL